MGKERFELRNGNPVLVKFPTVDFVDGKEGKPIGIQRFQDSHIRLSQGVIFSWGNSIL